MKKNVFIISIFACVLIRFSAPAAVFGESRIQGLDFALPDVKHFTTEKGLAVYCIGDELPMVTVTAAVGFGKLYEKKQNAGISSLLAKALSLGGSKKYPGAKLHETIEFIGGRFGVSSSWEQTYISLTVLARHAGTAMDILGSILTDPNLDERHIENARALLIEGIKRKNDQAHIVAFEKLRELIFMGNGYGATETINTVKSISARDLRNAVSRYFTARNTALSISAPFPVARTKALINKNMGTMAAGSRRTYTVDRALLARKITERRNNIYLIPRDVPQATIAMGTIAPSLKEGNIFPLTVMNYILGAGSFNSRLMQEIRVKRGLSYSTGSALRFRKNTGVFLAYAQTKTEMADKTFSLMLKNINDMATLRVSKKELAWTGESLKNSYVFEFNSTGATLGKFMYLHYNGLTRDFLNNYIRNIQDVTPDRIITHSKELLGNGLIKVVVGKKSLKKSLQGYGTVVVLE